MSQFPRVIASLRQWQAELVEQLRETGGPRELIEQKAEVDDALRLLTLSERYSLNPTARVVVLPDTGWLSYRIMIDDESDNRADWSEMSDEKGERLSPVGGDLLILNSESKNLRARREG